VRVGAAAAEKNKAIGGGCAIPARLSRLRVYATVDHALIEGSVIYCGGMKHPDQCHQARVRNALEPEAILRSAAHEGSRRVNHDRQQADRTSRTDCLTNGSTPAASAGPSRYAHVFAEYRPNRTALMFSRIGQRVRRFCALAQLALVKCR
jgi:hypothetical protein